MPTGSGGSGKGGGSNKGGSGHASNAALDDATELEIARERNFKLWRTKTRRKGLLLDYDKSMMMKGRM